MDILLAITDFGNHKFLLARNDCEKRRRERIGCDLLVDTDDIGKLDTPSFERLRRKKQRKRDRLIFRIIMPI